MAGLSRMYVHVPFLAAALVALGTPARAQTVTLDEGSFRISVGGEQVGTETFSIRQSGTGGDAVFIASGRVVLEGNGNRETAARLQVGGLELRPAAYEVQVQGDGARRIAGRVAGGRFSARIVSQSGENMREYLVSEGAVLADEGIAHHYYFLARRLQGASARMPLVIPQENRQVWAEVTARGNAAVTIGGASVQGRHLVVQPAGMAERHVWVDAENRVLKVEIPEHEFVAVRAAAP